MSLLLFSSAFYLDVEQRQAVQKRVSTMNSFLGSSEKDIERQMYVSSYRILVLLEKRIIDSKNYIPATDFNPLFNEAFFNGTLNSQKQDLMIGATFYEFINVTNENAKKMNLNLAITNPIINITQEDPWHVAVILKANLVMQDNSNLASWNKTLIIKSYIPIESFEDPVYLLNTGGQVPNKFIETPYTFSSTNIANLSLHLQNMYYINTTESPSFLDRLKGNISSSSPYGVESLVDINKLPSDVYIMATGSKSVVDHIYFSNQNPTPLCIVPGMPSWFRIDKQHAAYYNIAC